MHNAWTFSYRRANWLTRTLALHSAPLTFSETPSHPSSIPSRGGIGHKGVFYRTRTIAIIRMDAGFNRFPERRHIPMLRFTMDDWRKVKIPVPNRRRFPNAPTLVSFRSRARGKSAARNRVSSKCDAPVALARERASLRYPAVVAASPWSFDSLLRGRAHDQKTHGESFAPNPIGITPKWPIYTHLQICKIDLNRFSYIHHHERSQSNTHRQSDIAGNMESVRAGNAHLSS